MRHVYPLNSFCRYDLGNNAVIWCVNLPCPSTVRSIWLDVLNCDLGLSEYSYTMAINTDKVCIVIKRETNQTFFKLHECNTNDRLKILGCGKGGIAAAWSCGSVVIMCNENGNWTQRSIGRSMPISEITCLHGKMVVLSQNKGKLYGSTYRCDSILSASSGFEWIPGRPNAYCTPVISYSQKGDIVAIGRNKKDDVDASMNVYVVCPRWVAC